MVEALTVKVTAWEKERRTRFEYDNVRLCLLLTDETRYFHGVQQHKEGEGAGEEAPEGTNDKQSLGLDWVEWMIIERTMQIS
jgi:hypothetical protein